MRTDTSGRDTLLAKSLQVSPRAEADTLASNTESSWDAQSQPDVRIASPLPQFTYLQELEKGWPGLLSYTHSILCIEEVINIG